MFGVPPGTRVTAVTIPRAAATPAAATPTVRLALRLFARTMMSSVVVYGTGAPPRTDSKMS
jgi:hypothetical protein